MIYIKPTLIVGCWKLRGAISWWGWQRYLWARLKRGTTTIHVPKAPVSGDVLTRQLTPSRNIHDVSAHVV